MSRRSATTTKVFVGSLPGGVTTDDLRGLFEPYGPIAECDIANRCGFLHLEDKDLAFKAIEELNNTNFMGTRISVEKGRVKPPRSRRDGGGGPMRGGKDRGGPYSRDGFRGPPQRNGGYGRDYPPYGGGDRYDYDRGMPPRPGFDGGRYPDMGDRRGMYDDRGGYNGYDRRPPYGDDRPPYGDAPPPRGGYDDRRVPPGPGGYDDRRPLIGDRRGPVDDQGPGIRGPPAAYDRGTSGSDMFSRRDAGPKPLLAGNVSYNDRNSGGYGAGGGNGYGAMNAPAAGPGAVGGGSYGGAGAASTGYGTGNGGYTGPAGGGFGDARGAAAGAGYGASGGNYNAGAGGYGDSYGSGGRAGGYETAYPPVPQQRGFASGGGPGAGPRRDMPPGRRF